MSFEATGQAFGIPEEAFQHMVTTSDVASNRMIDDLIRTFTAAADAEVGDKQRRFDQRVGFLWGVKFTRIGFAG